MATDKHVQMRFNHIFFNNIKQRKRIIWDHIAHACQMLPNIDLNINQFSYKFIVINFLKYKINFGTSRNKVNLLNHLSLDPTNELSCLAIWTNKFNFFIKK